MDGGLGNRSDRLCVFRGLACFGPNTPLALVEASLAAGKLLSLFLSKAVDGFAQTLATIALATGTISVTAEAKHTKKLTPGSFFINTEVSMGAGPDGGRTTSEVGRKESSSSSTDDVSSFKDRMVSIREWSRGIWVEMRLKEVDGTEMSSLGQFVMDSYWGSQSDEGRWFIRSRMLSRSSWAWNLASRKGAKTRTHHRVHKLIKHGFVIVSGGVLEPS